MAGRWVYQNANSKYLYHWAEYRDWRIGNSYQSSVSNAASVSNNFDDCPYGASSWEVWDGSQWTAAYGVTVVTPCQPEGEQ